MIYIKMMFCNQMYLIKHLKPIFVLYILCIFLAGCTHNTAPSVPVQVAFVADVHFHDLFAEADVADLPYLSDGTPVLMRAMEAQIRSTRLFNENYFAFLATLDDIVSRNISYVVLNGDFSDDGQPIHLSGFIDILNHYEQTHGMRFFLSFGNHDPYLPYTQPAGKRDFLMHGGRVHGIFSTEHPSCTDETAYCLDGLEEYGYQDIFGMLSGFGFTPRQQDVFFETPFSYDDGFDARNIDHRRYEICTPDSTWCGSSFDTSYLVEPTPGIWLLSIDANVHVPVTNRMDDNILTPRNYASAGNAGFDAVRRHKPFLYPWITGVQQRAKSQQKQLFVFSHYPAGDFYHNSGDILAELFGESGIQLRRLPSEETRLALAATGIPFHVGGHMHLNNTHAIQDSTGRTATIGIQSPSISAYVPGYTIIHYEDLQTVHVETVVLNNVPGFNTLFDLYRQEWHQSDQPPWDLQILDADDYHDFTLKHLEELVKIRFVPQDWPDPVREWIQTRTFFEILSALDIPIPGTCVEDREAINLALDFYRFRNGGSLANEHVDETDLSCYMDIRTIMRQLPDGQADEPDLFHQIHLVLELLYRFSNPLPDTTYIIDLETMEITPLSSHR